MNRSVMRDSSAPAILVCCERDGEGEMLLRELSRTRARVTHIWPIPKRFPADFDVIVTEFSEGLVDHLPWMPGEAGSALVLLLPQHGRYDERRVRDCSPDGVLFRPLQPHMVRTALLTARSHFSYIRRLSTRIARLEEHLRAMRDIERAKTILMTSRQLGEDEAYAFIRQQAMERRITVAAYASAIIDSHKLLN